MADTRPMQYRVYGIGLDGDLYIAEDHPTESGAIYLADGIYRFTGRDALVVPLTDIDNPWSSYIYCAAHG